MVDEREIGLKQLHQLYERMSRAHTRNMIMRGWFLTIWLATIGFALFPKEVLHPELVAWIPFATAIFFWLQEVANDVFVTLNRERAKELERATFIDCDSRFDPNLLVILCGKDKAPYWRHLFTRKIPQFGRSLVRLTVAFFYAPLVLASGFLGFYT